MAFGGTPIGDATIIVGADARPFQSELGTQGAKAAKDAGGRISSALGNTLKKGAVATGAAVAGVLGTAFVKGFQRLDSIDKAKAKLTGLGHSGKTVETVMKNALASVKGTAFGLGDAASQAATMVAAGIKPGKDLERTLKLLADTSTIAGVNMNEVGAIFGKVAAGGKVTMEVVGQLQDRGVPALSFLAKATGKSMGQVQKDVSAGKITFEQFQTAMEKGLGGAALSSGKTFSGALANVGAALSRLGAGLLGGVFSQMPGVFGGITAAIDKLTPAAAKVGDALGRAFTKGLTVAKGLFALLVKGDYTASLGKALGLEEDSPIIGVLLTIRDRIAAIFEGIRQHNPVEIANAFGLAEDSPIVVGIDNLFQKFTNLKGLFSGGPPASGFIAGLATAAGGALVILQKVGPLAGKIMPFFSGLVPVIGKLASVFKFLGGPLTLIIGLLVTAYATSEPFRNGINALIAVLGTFVTQLVTALMPVFTQLATTLLPMVSNLFMTLAGVLGTVMTAVAPLISQLLTALVPVIVQIVKAVMPPLLAIFNALIPIILKLVSAVIPPLLQILRAIMPIITGVVIPAISALIDIIAKMLMPIIQALLPVVKTVFDAISNVIQAAMKIIRGIIQTVTALIKGDWTGVWNGIKTIFSGVWDGIKAIVSGALSIVKSLISAGFSVVKTTISGIWDGIKSLLKVGWDWISKNVFEPIKSGVKLVGDAFGKAKDFIGTQWDKLKDLAKAPIRFVIDTVLNKGIIGGFNWLSDKIGGPQIPKIPLPFAAGGVLPGYTPGRDVHEFFSPTAGRLSLSGGEAIMRPEFTRAVGGAAGVAALNRLARSGALPFANGGVFPGGHHSYGLGGIIDWIKEKGSGAFNWVTEKAGAVWDAVTNPLEFIKSKFSSLMGSIPGGKLISQYGAAAINKGSEVVVSKIKDLWNAFTGAFRTVQSEKTSLQGVKLDGDTASRILAASRASGAVMKLIQGSWSHNPLSKGTHAGAGAADLTSNMWNVAVNALRNAGLLAMFRNWTGNQHIHVINPHAQGLSPQAMQQVRNAMANNGIFATGGVFSYDKGGYLPRGLSMAYNGTGRPEPVGHGLGGPIIINMTVSVDDLAKMSKIGDFLEMLDRARMTARQGVVAS